MTYPLAIIPQPDRIRVEQQQRGRYMTAHERALNDAAEYAPNGVLVIAYQDADGEFTSVEITNVRR